MIEDLLINQVWIPIIFALILYMADHYMGIYEAYLYQQHAQFYLVYEGRYDRYRKLFDSGQPIWIPSISFVIVLIIVSLGIYASWYTMVNQVGRPELFLLILGGLILFQAAKCFVRFRNISFFRFAQNEGELKGKIWHSKRLTSTMLYQDFYGFTLIYLILFIIEGGWFTLGGILTCFIAARRHRDWAKVKT
jgi:hypothetical protein